MKLSTVHLQRGDSSRCGSRARVLTTDNAAVTCGLCLRLIRHEARTAEWQNERTQAASGYSPRESPAPPPPDAQEAEALVYYAYVAARELKDSPSLTLAEGMAKMDTVLDGLKAARRFIFDSYANKTKHKETIKGPCPTGSACLYGCVDECFREKRTVEQAFTHCRQCGHVQIG